MSLAQLFDRIVDGNVSDRGRNAVEHQAFIPFHGERHHIGTEPPTPAERSPEVPRRPDPPFYDQLLPNDDADGVADLQFVDPENLRIVFRKRGIVFTQPQRGHLNYLRPTQSSVEFLIDFCKPEFERMQNVNEVLFCYVARLDKVPHVEKHIQAIDQLVDTIGSTQNFFKQQITQHGIDGMSSKEELKSLMDEGCKEIEGRFRELEKLVKPHLQVPDADNGNDSDLDLDTDKLFTGDLKRRRLTRKTSNPRPASSPFASPSRVIDVKPD